MITFDIEFHYCQMNIACSTDTIDTFATVTPGLLIAA